MDLSYEMKRKLFGALAILCLILSICFVFLFFNSQNSGTVNDGKATVNSYDLKNLKSDIIKNEADRKIRSNELMSEIDSTKDKINELKPLIGEKASHKVIGIGIFISAGLLLSTLVLYNMQKKSF